MEPIPAALPNAVLEFTTDRAVLLLLVALSVPVGPAGAPALLHVAVAPRVDIIAAAAQLRLSRVTPKYVRLRLLLQELQIQSVFTHRGVIGVDVTQAVALEPRKDLITVGQETPNLVPPVLDAPVLTGVGGPHVVLAAAQERNLEHVILIGNSKNALELHVVHLATKISGEAGQHAVVHAMVLGPELMIAVQFKVKHVMYRHLVSIFPPPTMRQVVVALK